MIAAAFIVHWREVVPWAGDHQVEHDLILSRALIEIFSEPTLARALAFRGGTALHKLIFPAPLRYSDDIDLVQVASAPIGDVMRTLRRRLDSIRGASAFERSPNSHTAVYRFPSEIPPTRASSAAARTKNSRKERPASAWRRGYTNSSSRTPRRTSTPSGETPAGFTRRT